MEAEWLAEQLEAGRSIEAIARDTGRAPSTVAYWVNKHGLRSLHALRHRAKGGLTREQLEPLVAAGIPIRAMAEQLGVSYTTVRHWLRRHDLTTARARRLAETAPARANGWESVEGICPHHGPVTFVRRGTECFRCQRCRSEAVDRRRRKIKRILVEEAGGSCLICGYSRTLAGLHFHHVDPASKVFGLGERGVTISLEAARAEARKCVLLCSNCHAEVETGIASLP
jgi:transposase-like protein